MKQILMRIASWLLIVATMVAVVLFFGRTFSALAINKGTISYDDVLPTSTLSPVLLEQKEDFAKEIQELVQKKEDSVFKPGWLHVVSQVQANTDPSSVLPNGVQIPNEYIMEDWYLLDTDGKVLQAASFMRDTKNNIIQESVLYKGNWHNLTLNDITSSTEFKPKIDFGFSEMAIAQGTKIEKQDFILEGRDAILYVITEEYLDYNKKYAQILVRAYFDPAGNLSLIETVLVAVDGSETLDSSNKVLIVENIQDPSDDVIKSLEEVSK